jgi:flagellar basal-body rod protein FlgB
MFEGTTFGKTTAILKRAMDVSMLRRDVIANNIANSGVPNFKRSTVNFESSLQAALDAESAPRPLAMTVSDPRHISGPRRPDWRQVEPRRVLDYLTSSKNNGNNVDAEEEMMASLTNQLQYSLLVQAESFEFSQVNSVLK